MFGPELAMESRPGGEKRPSALPTLLLVLGVEEGVQMLPLHPQVGGRMGRGAGADYGLGGEECLQGSSLSRGGPREPKAGSLDNFIKKFRLERGPEAWVIAEGGTRVKEKIDTVCFCADRAEQGTGITRGSGRAHVQNQIPKGEG